MLPGQMEIFHDVVPEQGHRRIAPVEHLCRLDLGLTQLFLNLCRRWSFNDPMVVRAVSLYHLVRIGWVLWVRPLNDIIARRGWVFAHFNVPAFDLERQVVHCGSRIDGQIVGQAVSMSAAAAMAMVALRGSPMRVLSGTAVSMPSSCIGISGADNQSAGQLDIAGG